MLDDQNGYSAGECPERYASRTVATFVCGADETTGTGPDPSFTFGGWITLKEVWEDEIAPEWDERVIQASPAIPYFHVYDLRLKEWCDAHGLSREDAERKIDAAIDVVSSSPLLFALTMTMKVSDFEGAAEYVLENHPSPGLARTKAFLAQGDMIAFSALVQEAIGLAMQCEPRELKRVDFVVEEKRPLTHWFERFHHELPETLRNSGVPELASLARFLGEFYRVQKKDGCVLTEASDLLCWFEQRHRSGLLSGPDIERHKRLAAVRGIRKDLPAGFLRLFADVTINGDEGLKRVIERAEGSGTAISEGHFYPSILRPLAPRDWSTLTHDQKAVFTYLLPAYMYRKDDGSWGARIPPDAEINRP